MRFFQTFVLETYFNNQLNAQIFILNQYVCYITIFNMFRALTCASSGGQIVLSQHLVSSISVEYSTVQYAG
jgi:hypothetical protein